MRSVPSFRTEDKCHPDIEGVRIIKVINAKQISRADGKSYGFVWVFASMKNNFGNKFNHE